MPSDTTLETIAPELLTTAEAARLVNVGQRTLWRWSRCGICPPPIKLGTGKTGAVRYSRETFLTWIRAGCPRVDGRPGR